MKKSNVSRKVLTTTLPNALLRELDRAAKELGLAKNKIIAEAFTAWNEKRKEEFPSQKRMRNKH